MSATDQTSFCAAVKALRLRIPFVLYRLPGENGVKFFADNLEASATTDCQQFEIGPWLAPYAQRIVIRDLLSADDVIAMPEAEAALPEPKAADSKQFTEADTTYHNITKEEYIKAVTTIIGRCAQRNGKTVYSRVISGDNPTLDLASTASELFAMFPDAFGFLYYTPQTGCWIGATPETLLSVDLSTRQLFTMAYAGTRPNAGDEPWDGKNLHENSIVADYIYKKLNDLGIQPEISSPQTATYGDIQHIRRDIMATLPDGLELSSLIDAINPTPALCGTPLNDAIADITELEPHRRNCYGGFIALHQLGCSFHSFVNLRSAHLQLRPLQGDNQAVQTANGTDATTICNNGTATTTIRYNIFVGGGIIAQSNPGTEWNETCAKASRLLRLLSK
jgi:isochorismate synthase